MVGSKQEFMFLFYSAAVISSPKFRRFIELNLAISISILL